MSQGLWVAFLGMAMVFMALGVLLVMIIALDRAFRHPTTRKEPAVSPESTPTESDFQDKELAAAIGLGLALAQRRPSNNLGGQPTQASAWRLAGRRRQMAPPVRRW